MKVKELDYRSSLFFKCSNVKQETIVDALDFFVERLKKLSIDLDGVYPGDVFSLPFAMYISDRTATPLKTENFIKKTDKLLLVFSALPFEFVSEKYISEKTSLFRKIAPNSPSLLILSERNFRGVDFQLIKGKVERLFSYQFIREARENFFWPTEGEVTAVSERLWELSRKELSNFLRAKRIRDSARKYLRDEEVVNLNLIDSDAELSLWEKFKKGNLVKPSLKGKGGKGEKITVEKLFQIRDPHLSSAVTSVLEYVSQSIEYRFPTYLAYSNVEITERKGVLIVPKVTEELNGADLRVEFIVRLEKIKENLKKVNHLIQSSIVELAKDVFKKDFFTPQIDSSIDEKLNRGSIYLSWYIDREMADRINEKINRRWLLSRLLYRKRIKTEFLELIKLIENFEFNLENLELLKAKLGSLWRKNSNLFKAKSREIFSAIEKGKLWPLVAIFSVKETSLREPLDFLIKLKGYENYHHLLSNLDTYYTPVLTKRIYRPNWERVIRGKLSIFLKGEPLNPKSFSTYVLQTGDGKFLGTLPKTISHYILAKERQGKRVTCRELYFEPDVFSENSYWVEIKCL
ncbi:hypothetical protein SAMN06269117_1236 [Balnearium lithotrophicum]|uniref:Uncharacterized protein n=1 Tax=Balnearium lithotrophicum TaxID=223788 RepID=A0A521DP23_9BACT|nr:hypothetical protein [Balnearium lithotrophicum]SMO72831.1 hypothetical protein SAMN06269117_1236 [Balnearium lithotrophicum]